MNDPSRSHADTPPTGKKFAPFISADRTIPELTFTSVFLGCVLAAVFGAANAYLGLKLGMTVSASIPAAVMSMAILQGILRRGTILEHNMVQTIGSSGESLAAGIVFTIPALIFVGVDPSLFEIFILAMTGGVLGIFFMIPLRHHLMVEEHGKLTFPEGTACAEVLKAGQTRSMDAIRVGIGMVTGAGLKFLAGGLKLWTETPYWESKRWYNSAFGFEGTPVLLGVGYIIGLRIAGIMLAGAILGWWVLIPLITYFGQYMTAAVPPGTVPISEMSASMIRRAYLLYIGAGAVTAGGLISLLKSTGAWRGALRFGTRTDKPADRERTDRDLPAWSILAVPAVAAIVLWLYPGVPVPFVGVVMTLIFGFLFVAVSARVVGMIGSSSLPVSGMTIATLLLVAIMFRWLGMSGPSGVAAVLSIGAVVCIAVSLSGDASQDLKTGMLLGATPRAQQIGEIFGLVVPACVIGWVLMLLHRTYGLGSETLSAPQATLMAMVVKGVLEGTMPWVLVLTGVALGVALEMASVPALPFAIGLYLPLPLSVSVFLGALFVPVAKWILRSKGEFDPHNNPGILTASGLVAGDALTGVLIAGLASLGWEKVLKLGPLFWPAWDNIAATLAFLGAGGVLLWSLKLGEKKKV